MGRKRHRPVRMLGGTVELCDRITQPPESPIGFLVVGNDLNDYVFADLHDAESFAITEDEENDDGETRLVYPLWASRGFPADKLPASWR